MHDSENSIDWQAEWQKHAYGFKDGLSHIHFEDLGIPCKGEVFLLPGAGFGDLSHPTTKLVLKAMHPHVQSMHVLDVGCGSGILSLAAARFGAASVYGIDIDDEAIAHSIRNADYNHLPCRFGKKAKPADIILMNMIRSEQKQAKTCLPNTYKFAFTSGILKEERTLYLEQTKEWGWSCLQEWELDGWLGFHFKFH